MINGSWLRKLGGVGVKDMEVLDVVMKKSVCIGIEGGVVKCRRMIVDGRDRDCGWKGMSGGKSLEYYWKEVMKVVNCVDERMELGEVGKEKKYCCMMSGGKRIVGRVEGEGGSGNMGGVKEGVKMVKERIWDGERGGVI